MSGAAPDRRPGQLVHTLLGPDGLPYRSDTAGALGSHRRGRLYGRLDCPSALRALARGQYARHRVLFADEATALAAGYRPCTVCLPEKIRPLDIAAALPRGHVMNPYEEAGRTASPKVRTPAATGSRIPPHTEAELSALLGLLTGGSARVRSVAVGHGRDPGARATAEAFATAWQDMEGDIVAVVDWPEEAASWLRPARRLTAGAPDAWVLSGAPIGVAQLLRRLRHSTDWDPARTYCFAGLGTPEVVQLAGAETVDGLRGAAADGGRWEMRRGWLTHFTPHAGAGKS